MAPPLVVANAVQVRLGWAIANEGAFNILNCVAAPTVLVGGLLADQVGSAIKAAFTAQWAPHCPTNVELRRVGVRDLRVADQPEYLDNGGTVAGTGAVTDLLPSASAMLITLRTAKAGRSFRGRIYLPGSGEADNSLAALQSSALRAAGAAFINAINSALQPLNMPLGVLSRPSDDIVVTEVTTPVSGPVKTRVISHTVAKAGEINAVTLVESRNDRWEYQRRRGNGRGLGVSSSSAFVGFRF